MYLKRTGKTDVRGSNMDTKKYLCEDDDEFQDIYDDPSLDALITTLCRSDDKEWRQKEINRKTKRLTR